MIFLNYEDVQNVDMKVNMAQILRNVASINPTARGNTAKMKPLLVLRSTFS